MKFFDRNSVALKEMAKESEKQVMRKRDEWGQKMFLNIRVTLLTLSLLAARKNL